MILVPDLRRTTLKEKALLVITTAVVLLAVLVLPLALELKRSQTRNELYSIAANAEMKTWNDNIVQAKAEVQPGDVAEMNKFVKATFGTPAICSWSSRSVSCKANGVTEVIETT
jgi:hypothetical protein